jgi:vacuolar-type H+-ATPase subunit I/STV1
VKIKLIIIIAVIGLISFGVTFFVGMKTKKVPVAAVTNIDPNAAVEADKLNLSSPRMAEPVEGEDVMSAKRRELTEKQLKDLIYEVREKINEYDYKLKELELREKNLQAAKDTLKSDINELDNLRIELTTTVSAIKTEQDRLQKTMIQISTTEENNLKSIAASYDKMDAAQAGKILSNMNQVSRNASADDAIKILYYMQERTKAKVLAAIAETEPAISANFCQRLKKISVKE